MLEMYAPMVNSPITELATAIDDTQTTIEVVDGSKLPDAPNLAMIGLGENTETILYTQKDGNVLSGVTRGFQGIAKAWPQGARVARFFAAYDQMAIQENIKTLDQSLAAHLNDFAQVWNNRIVEMGENANGTYVRWENGLQICWHHFRVVGTLNQGSKASAIWTFPAQFIDPPVVVANEGGSPAFASEITIGVVRSAEGSSTSATIYARANVRNVENVIWAYCVAFGRWK